MKKVLINNLKYGQLGNQLFFQAHTLAYSIEKGDYIIVLNFNDYAKFINLNAKGFKIIFIGNKLLNFFFTNLARLFSRFRFQNNITPLVPFIESKRFPIVFLNKWNFENNFLVAKHKEKLFKILSFRDEYTQMASQFYSNVKSKNSKKKIVGVHIRRGDYKTWQNGKYFYTFDDYQDLLERLIKNNNEEFYFIICSDEKITSNDLPNIKDCITVSSNFFITDLLVLSKCDLIIGPPSTFNAWASFIGQKPLLTIKSLNINPLICNFKINQGDIISLTD